MFYLAPHPKYEKPLRGSPRMFSIGWVEKYFSRVRPWHVVALWVPISLACLWRQLAMPHLSVAHLVLAYSAGVLVWTLTEYLLHRFVFHFHPNPKSEWQNEASYLIHGIHHQYPWDADRLVMPPTVSLLIGAGLWFVLKLIFGAYALAAFSGISAGYIWYDLMHYHVHHAKPTTAIGRWLRRYHLVHHFGTPNQRYGITTPLWDFVFATYPKDEHSRATESADALEARQ